MDLAYPFFKLLEFYCYQIVLKIHAASYRKVSMYTPLIFFSEITFETFLKQIIRLVYFMIYSGGIFSLYEWFR